MTLSRNLKIGTNRNSPRVWIEKSSLLKTGWQRGDRFDCEFRDGSVVYTKNATGKRAVAGTVDRPIIDTNSHQITDSLGNVPRVAIVLTPSTITLTPSN